MQSRRVVLPGRVEAARIDVRDGKIVAVGPWARADGSVIDVGSRVIMPGLIDSHVHVNEPGHPEWEGFETATRAAAAGGVTTIVDMPLNSIPVTVDAAALDVKQDAARRSAWVDVGFLGGIVPDNRPEVAGLAAGGVLGFKCFLVDSGLAEFSPVSLGYLDRIAPELARWSLPLLVHAEDPSLIEAASRRFRSLPSRGRRSYRAYLDSRPARAEEAAVERLVGLADRHEVRIHIVHVSSAEAAQILEKAREKGLRMSGETCPHYLMLTAEEIPAGATEFKCSPPIREAANQERLWQALERGAIDFVVSDHSPCPPDLKASGDFGEDWGGISSLQLRLPATWTAARVRGIELARLADWLAAGPARLLGLSSKGTIAPGADADLVVWDPEASFEVRPETLLHRHPLCPYLGRRLHGVVEATFLRGNLVWDGRSARIRGDRAGRLLSR